MLLVIHISRRSIYPWAARERRAARGSRATALTTSPPSELHMVLMWGGESMTHFVEHVNRAIVGAGLGIRPTGKGFLKPKS